MGSGSSMAFGSSPKRWKTQILNPAVLQMYTLVEMTSGDYLDGVEPQKAVICQTLPSFRQLQRGSEPIRDEIRVVSTLAGVSRQTGSAAGCSDHLLWPVVAHSSVPSDLLVEDQDSLQENMHPFSY